MSDESPKTSANPTLDYATTIGAYPEPRAHSRMMLALIGCGALAGVWSIILGVMCLGDIWVFGILLCTSGAALCWATLGKLSANSFRPRAAIFLLSLAILINVPTGILANSIARQQYRIYRTELAAFQSDSHHLPTDAERQVYTYEMIVACTTACAGLAFGSLIYAAIRVGRRRFTA